VWVWLSVNAHTSLNTAGHCIANMHR
jgi:hypothetical protein